MRAALGVVAAALVLAGVAAAGEGRPTLADLEGEVMCPVCGTTLDQSDAPVARQMKMFIRARIRAGDTESEIKDKLVASFGEEVLAAPPKEGFNLLAWVLPLAGLAIGVPALGFAAWRWSRREREDSGAGEPIDDELDRRLERELHGY